MRSGKHLTLIGSLIVVGLISGVFFKVYAESPPPTQTEVGGDTGKAVLVKAVALNTDIKEEIAKLREQRRSEQENLDQFVASALQQRFVNYDMRTKSGLKGYQLEATLKGTALEGLGDAYAKAEEESGVSALVLMGISAHESSWGTSPFAQERNNLFGFQAYDSNVDMAKHFKSKEECILLVSKHLAEKYLVEGGDYFNGYTLADVNIRYASAKNWNVGITDTLNSFVQKLK